MSQIPNTAIAVIGIDISKNSFHVVGHGARGAILGRLAQRLKQLEQDGVVYIEAKAKGKGHLYRLTPAGEDFRSIVELACGAALGTRSDRPR